MKLIFLFLFPFFIFGQKQIQDSTPLTKHFFEIQYSSLNFSFFGGTLMLGNYFYKLNERHSLGLSLGIFYHQNKDDNNKIMKYTYFPFFLFYKFKMRKHFLKFEIGTPMFSFFDSDYYVLKDQKTFWPKYNQISKEKKYERKKHFFIFSPSINFRLSRGLYLITGFTLYLGNEYPFSFLKLGLSYRIN